jgi:hypothetical protein
MSNIAQPFQPFINNNPAGAHTKSGDSDAGSDGYNPGRRHPFFAAAAHELS